MKVLDSAQLSGSDGHGVRRVLRTGGPRSPALTHTVLLQRVWDPERVGEGWLVRDMVKRLRRKLGNAATSPRYVITDAAATSPRYVITDVNGRGGGGG